MQKIHSHTVNFGGKEIKLEIGRFAQQATAAVVATMGETVVLATVVMSKARKDISWFPLQVEFQEKLYAGGKIKGSRWVKRDGRPTDDVILKSRLIDRSIRPLFPDGFKNEVQIIITVLSADEENDADMPAMLAVSAALSLSEIPWAGPIAGARMGFIKETGEVIVNPTYTQRETSDLDLVISASKDATLMVEAGANEVSEADMIKVLTQGQEAITDTLSQLQTFIDKHAKAKIEFTPIESDPEMLKRLKEFAGDKINEFVKAWAQLESYDKDTLFSEFKEKYAEEEYSDGDLEEALFQLMKKEVRRITSKEGHRPDGRKNDEIRELSSEVSVLPRTHGSAVFQRGSTQALTITTLGSPDLNQLIESMVGEEEKKRYIHHYNMPPYTVGEAGRVGWPSRREIGHGALAERALEPMIPSEEEFPYTIHVVSEIMSSNGSTSQASVCGSTLSLMDAGVPIKRPVSGIAMGLIREDGEHIILSDIQGLEDFTGDMDFKVAGTTEGITAIQMDIKIEGIPHDVLVKALEQARVGRQHILDSMLATLPEPRKQLSKYAPKITTITIEPERIGELIGPGGKVIKNIIAETGAQISVEDDGRVFISSVDDEAIAAATEWIQNMMREIEIGEEFDGKVVRIENYGAFVNLVPGKDGLLHVSNMSKEYVGNVHDVVSMDQEIHVRVKEIDEQGKIGLTALTPEEEAEAKEARASRPPREGGDRGGFRGGDRRGGFGRGGDRGRGGRGGDRGGRR